VNVAPEREDVAAQYGDETITFEELDMPIASKIYELERGIYQLRMDRLNAILVDALIEKEAVSRGISVDDLLREVAPPSAMAVTDQEVDKYYQDNQDRMRGWTGTIGELKNRIRSHLEQQKRYETITRYAVSLRPKYGVTIHLSEPASLNIRINTEGSPALGPENAAVTVVQFSDYRCPACKKAHATVAGLKALFKDKVRWVFKDFPLRRHPDAHISAEAARCAGEQGKVWEFQDVLYGADGELNKEKLVDLAAGAGLDKQAFSACLASGKYVQGVDKDIRDGRQVGVDRTPCFFINGKMVTGSLAPEVFRSAIEAELNKAKAENTP
jgi:protein-disulfide isomerase